MGLPTSYIYIGKMCKYALERSPWTLKADRYVIDNKLYLKGSDATFIYTKHKKQANIANLG